MSSRNLNLIHLDGTTLEGGGQLLRLALTISTINLIPIHITSIRGNRGPKTTQKAKDAAVYQSGGLMPAHLAAVKWLAGASRAETEGMELKSRELVFRPQRVDWFGARKELWKDVYDEGKVKIRDLVCRESKVEMKTAGAVTLIFQAMLPCLLWGSVWRRDGEGRELKKATPLRIFIEGGTNVTSSLSFEYMDQVLFPMVNRIIGREAVKCSLVSRGWTTGKTNVGRIKLDVVPFDPGETLKAFNLSDQGDIVRFQASIIAPSSSAVDNVRKQVTKEISQRRPNVEIDFPVEEESRHHKRLYLLIVAQTTNGHRLAHDWLYNGKPKLGFQTQAEAIDALVSRVVEGLESEIDSGACVDTHMQDQLVVFQALAEGKSTVTGRNAAEVSLHTQTARWVVERLLKVSFDENGSCEGIGVRAGVNEFTDEALVEEICDWTVND